MDWLSRHPRLVSGVLTLAFVAPTLAPAEAQACGGLFCDGGDPMPVDQAEEQVLFVRDGAFMETHIRVVYDGDVENFAWVIPLFTDGVPTFTVGSDALFGRLDVDSRATFPLTNIGGEDDCSDWGESGGDATGGFAPMLDIGGGNEPPTVETQGTVGSFEFAVLSGGTVESLMQWLEDNGYQQDPAAEPILEDYLMEGAKFAAVKLAASADAEAIHPIAVRYEGMEPCVPLRLTAIAAEEDMGVRLFALDEERLVPQNFEHVYLNWLRLQNWNAFNYRELVTMAVDEAGGRAFTTEYVGTSAIIERWGIWERSWDASAFVDIEPHLVTQTLIAQGFMGHPLLAAIMRKYLPAPEGYDENDFWNNLEFYQELIDQQAWSGTGFASELDTMIIQPGARAVELLDTRPLLSRLFTTISPHEMLEDPLFFYRSDLGEVSRTHQGQRESECDHLGVWTVGPWEVCETAYDSWPEVDGLPWAQRVERIPPVGAAQTVFDHTAAINVLVEEHNDAACDLPNPGGTSSTTGTSTSGGTGSATAGDDESGDGASQDDEKSGCACRADGRGSTAWLLFGGLGLLSLRRRRK